MNYLQFDFETETGRQTELLIALLADQGFEGFEEEDNYLKAFIPEDKHDSAGFWQVLDKFSSISYTKTMVEQINWNQKWEQDFKPVIVDGFVGIRAGFHQPTQGVIHDIIITPKMSFGTGHHATTYLMIQQMEHINFNAKTVLDFGTGTGILAILAKKLGARRVVAIDYDEWSIINARENFISNGANNILIEALDTVPLTEKYDVILANINLNIIKANLKSIEQSLNAGAYCLLSGLLKENEMEMRSAIAQTRLQYLSTKQKGDWIVLLLQQGMGE